MSLAEPEPEPEPEPPLLAPYQVRVYDAGDSLQALCVRGAEWDVVEGGRWVWRPLPHQRGNRLLNLSSVDRGWFVLKVYLRAEPSPGKAKSPSRSTVQSKPFTLPATLRLGEDGQVTIDRQGSPSPPPPEPAPEPEPGAKPEPQPEPEPEPELASLALLDSGDSADIPAAMADPATPLAMRVPLIGHGHEQPQQEPGSGGTPDVLQGGDPTFHSPPRADPPSPTSPLSPGTAPLSMAGTTSAPMPIAGASQGRNVPSPPLMSGMGSGDGRASPSSVTSAGPPVMDLDEEGGEMLCMPVGDMPRPVRSQAQHCEAVPRLAPVLVQACFPVLSCGPTCWNRPPDHSRPDIPSGRMPTSDKPAATTPP